MRSIKRILMPLDLQERSMPAAAIQQADFLARHFHSEIVVLNVLRPFTYAIASAAAMALLEQAVAEQSEKLESCLLREFEQHKVRRIMAKGDPAREILAVAREENADLILMPSHGYGRMEGLLLGSVTTKLLGHCECPFWIAPQTPPSEMREFQIRSVLCAVDFSPTSLKTTQTARDLADEFLAKLTLAHATPGVEIYGPGGSHELHGMKEELVNSAKRHMAKLQTEAGTNAETFIGSGDVGKVIAQAATESHADLVVGGRRFVRGPLGRSLYDIIHHSSVPILIL
jgi:nucleotide-binding universal stress UspA family protein